MDLKKAKLSVVVGNGRGMNKGNWSINDVILFDSSSNLSDFIQRSTLLSNMYHYTQNVQQH